MLEKECLTVTDIAQTMGISRPTVYALLNRVERPLPSIRIGRRRIIPRQAFFAWLNDETMRGGARQYV